MIAALFVHPGGVYFNLPDVDPWDKERDARTYAGPYPVVAHPPCERWGNFWHGQSAFSVDRRQMKGDDGGCFATALHAVRIWGGVLEHPESSSAWSWFQIIAPPHEGGWVKADWLGGWTCRVEQGNYGHRGRKGTWLYACGVTALPSLKWGASTASVPVENMGKRERLATPIQFRDMLLDIARSVQTKERAA